MKENMKTEPKFGFKIRMLCYDYTEGNVESYWDEPAYNPYFREFSDVFSEAVALAEDECSLLNETASEGDSYAVNVNRELETVSVTLTHGNAAANPLAITVYCIEKVRLEETLTLFGFTDTHANADKYDQEVSTKSTVCVTKEEAEERAWKTYCREYNFAKSYGLLKPSEKKVRRPAFVRELWNGKMQINRTDLQVRFDGWMQILHIGGDGVSTC